ncbi:hypothetical protein Hanom_Chr14g01286761 [Helianthus anomalus]
MITIYSSVIIPHLFRKITCTVRRIQDLIVEHGEVKRQSKTDRVSWSQFCIRNILQP